MIEKLLKEAEKLGFKKCIIPENNKKLLKEKIKLDIIGVKNIKDAMKEVRTIITKEKVKRNRRGERVLKNEKGITLIVLIVTVVIMLILVYAGITYGSYSISEVKLQNFAYELQQIQGKVDHIYQKMCMEEDTNYASLNGKNLGVNMGYSTEAMDILKEIRGIDYTDATTQSNPELYADTNVSMYRYFSKRELDKTLDIKNAQHDVIINFKTREVISVDGVVCDDIEYHRLQDF